MPDATIPLLVAKPRIKLCPMTGKREKQFATISSPNPLVAGFHFRGKLPHLKKEGSVYFVTFRLADSLPAHEVARLKYERRVILEQARAAKSPLTWHEEEQLLAWYCDKVETLLDAGHGACWLSKAEIADLLKDALLHFDGERYELRAWVIMPNHVHAVVWPMPDRTLSGILHGWKSFTSSRANQILHRTGEDFWQAESFDHWIRNDEEGARLVAYVENNPVKAGFCKCPEDWRWSSANARMAR
jgi:REP element-mobilizing transposase RayT